ncbi:CdaR family transcriptional regulator, partial [Gordonia sp. (in: high G+C Gram-positive bacteria)]|uniref:PucR family transcriptional regulator n=1 Tax=Gordonia sp. (in: high G+C Gram-positive bacteria) TaxID=84139 RepID=UPI002628586C
GDEVEFYRDDPTVSEESLHQTSVDNLTLVFRSLEHRRDFDLTAATQTGRLRAEQGVPLPAVMAAFRVAAHQVWQGLRETLAGMPTAGAELALAATEKIWSGQDSYVEAMASAHREATMRRVIDDEYERAALVEALLQGRHLVDYTRWEVAQLLRMPADGPYVVIAAAPPMIGRLPLPEIAARLRAVDTYSAWRLFPDIHLGLVHVSSPAAHRATVDLLGRVATTPVGISPPFDDLIDTSVHMRYARLAMESVPAGELIREFDDSVLGVAAISAPDVTRKIADVILGAFAGLASDDQQLLTSTFHAWMAADGSVDDAAYALSCHPNTVRYRLRRIEKVTDRSLRVPRDLAELCLAFEIRERL